ncbi:peptidoglycan D,D-transpeptidase FtsI family protein [Ornithinimicrobium cerasi]|uniref:Peptidoglycan synthetase FtsI n=1 Tax=Ornithinimicrobium cerasi TaxID=2248773 RepID=A0A285VD88_9MICO|nr:penicillin-binding protein 2 [Ornithinimicrobium cerasi]SOC51953.1 peptidoglycan synthetase FtsI [Ornithinimicrobium cerasi]
MLLLGCFLVLSLFAAQLVRLQGLDAASVSAAALDGRLAVRSIPAERGTITDVNGEPLAISSERRRVVADPTLVVDYTLKDDEGEIVAEGFAAAAQVVSEVTGADRGTLLEKLENPEGDQYAILLPDVSPQTWQELRQRNVRGLSAESFMRRDYPLGEAAAPLLGWVGAGGLPAGGIELVKDQMLTGTPGEAVYEQGRDGEMITTGLYEEEPAQPGEDVRLSIDADLQWYAFDALRTRVKEAGALRGYAVVQEVETGRIVALANYPTFDPAEPSQTSEEMRNAAIEDVYEPGSTAKLITAAAALEEGIVERDTPVEVPVSLPRAGRAFRDVEPHPILHLTFAGVIARSSNMGTILAAEELGDQRLYDWIRRFGLGTPVGHGLPGESAGLVPEPGGTIWSATTPYTMMFGQGLSGSFLQQVGVFQSIANDGVRLTPSFVQGTVDAEGRYTETTVPEGTRVVSEGTAQTLTEIMQQIPATGGTAPLAAVDGYHVAGKTSTADRIDEKTGRYSGVTSSFIGFAPAEDPKYVVGVAVQRPTKVSRFGGVISGPVFASIMRYALQKEGVEPASTPPLTLELEYDPGARAPGEPSGVTLGDIAVKDEGTP